MEFRLSTGNDGASLEGGQMKRLGFKCCVAGINHLTKSHGRNIYFSSLFTRMVLSVVGDGISNNNNKKKQEIPVFTCRFPFMSIYRMVPPILRVGFPTFTVDFTFSIKSLWKLLCRHAQRCISQMVPSTVELTIKDDVNIITEWIESNTVTFADDPWNHKIL